MHVESGLQARPLRDDLKVVPYKWFEPTGDSEITGDSETLRDSVGKDLAARLFPERQQQQTDQEGD